MKIILGLVWAVLIVAFMVLATVGLITDHAIYTKLAMVIGGFLFYSILMLSINKDDYDDTGKSFPIIEYAEKTWENWLLNWIGAILLLLTGHQILGVINLMEDTKLVWSDAYYAGSGFIVNFAIDKWKTYQKKKKAGQ